MRNSAMTYATVCSGIEAPSVAWHPLGWNAAWFSEIEPFPCAVLKARFPAVPNLGDMTRLRANPLIYEKPIDLLCGGTPCQSFSVAGLRGGLDDERGNLALEFARIVDALRPRWVLWENVPGVLSSNAGRDFGSIVGALAELRYGWAYRVLDAQYFGVPQRRKRVFLVGHSGNPAAAAAVLFERHSLLGNPPPRREAGKAVAGTLTARFGKGKGASNGDINADGYLVSVHLMGSGAGTQRIAGLETEAEYLVPFDTTQITSPGNHSSPKPGDPCHPLASNQHPPAIAFRHWASSADNGIVQEEATSALRAADTQGQAVAYGLTSSVTPKFARELSPTLTQPSPTGGGQPAAVCLNMAVRRLTPRECERLQGFPDDYTRIPYPRTPAADTPRYKALGNSMAVPVVRWIGERIQAVDQILNH